MLRPLKQAISIWSVAFGLGIAATMPEQPIAFTVRFQDGGRDFAGSVRQPFLGLAFPAVPWGLYNGRPWFFPDGGWYKLLDWVT